MRGHDSSLRAGAADPPLGLLITTQMKPQIGWQIGWQIGRQIGRQIEPSDE